MQFKWIKQVMVRGYTIKVVLEQIFCDVESIFPPQTQITFGNEKLFINMWAEYDLESNMQAARQFEEIEREEFESRISDLEERGWVVIKEESIFPEKVRA